VGRRTEDEKEQKKEEGACIVFLHESWEERYDVFSFARKVSESFCASLLAVFSSTRARLARWRWSDVEGVDMSGRGSMGG
jgi:hypothetical protein